jgi:hypothetical protein
MWDMPYGYKLFPLDIQVTPADLDTIGKQFDAINTSSHYVSILMHKTGDSNLVIDHLTQRHYTHICPFGWYKEGHITTGPPTGLARSLEIGHIGFYPNFNLVPTNLPDNPVERHNHISCPSVTSLAKDSHNEPINVTEKPPEICEWLMKMLCPASSTVLIVGTGACGDVMGAVRAHVNVVGVEVDDAQYQASRAHLEKLRDFFEQEEKEALQQQEREELDADSAVEENPAETDDGSSSSKDSSVAAGDAHDTSNDPKPPKCPECAKEVLGEKEDYLYCRDCIVPVPMHDVCLNVHDANLESEYRLCNDCNSKADSSEH